MKNIIEFSHIKKYLRDRYVLNDFTLAIQEGETFVLVGQSGTGKSVLLKHIIGLMTPDEGRITIHGKDMTRASELEWNAIRASIGLLFQNGAIFDSMTVGQNLLFVLDNLCPEMLDREKKVRVSYCLDVVGLANLENTMPSELSGGMRKRAALARSIVTKPKILLFDEPTTGLDPIMTAVVDQLIIDVKKELGTTFIIVTHDMASAKRVADRIGLLFQGKINFLGTVADLDNSDNPYMNQFLAGDIYGPMTKD
ncbi:MAG: ABC transporter ATP-binding protein [Brevinemataceae bacterium]